MEDGASGPTYSTEKGKAECIVPLHLFVVLLLSGLSLHLLHLNGVGLPPPHVQLMVSHT